MGPYEGVDYNSPCLKVNSVVSYPSPLQRERGGVGRITPVGSTHLYLSGYFETTNRKRESTEKGEGRSES
jgi:hypothetical protein